MRVTFRGRGLGNLGTAVFGSGAAADGDGAGASSASPPLLDRSAFGGSMVP